MKNLSGYISGSYSAFGLDDEKVAAFRAAVQAVEDTGRILGVVTNVSLTITDTPLGDSPQAA